MTLSWMACLCLAVVFTPSRDAALAPVQEQRLLWQAVAAIANDARWRAGEDLRPQTRMICASAGAGVNAGSLPSAGLAEGAEPPPIPLRIKVGEGSVREVRFDRRTTRFPALSRAVRAHRTRLVGCFDAALEHAPFLNGWLTIRVQLGDDPSTLRPEVEENALIVGTMRVGTAKPPEPGVTEKWRLFSNARFGNVPRRVIPTLEQCLVGVVESITLAEPTTPVESTVIRFSRGPSAP